MGDSSNFYSERHEAARIRLTKVREELHARLGAIEQVFPDPDLCIYATGSLARLEATANSDLDAFFLLSGRETDKPLGRIRDVKILNAVVQTAEANDFPDFSNDGEYLKFLHIGDVTRHIGDREDDYHNALTARMLMILESQYLYNSDLYEQFKILLIDAYFADFHDHSRSFRPIFLLNDVIRFWRTMCLNYENGRQWRDEVTEKRAKGHLANLKLKFSRLIICYSFIIHLFSKGSALTQEDVMETSSLTPLDRLRDIADREHQQVDTIHLLLDKYQWFLEHTAGTKEDVLAWIAQTDKREEAFDHAHCFVESTGILAQAVAEKHGYLRYLVI